MKSSYKEGSAGEEVDGEEKAITYGIENFKCSHKNSSAGKDFVVEEEALVCNIEDSKCSHKSVPQRKIGETAKQGEKRKRQKGSHPLLEAEKRKGRKNSYPLLEAERGSKLPC